MAVVTVFSLCEADDAALAAVSKNRPIDADSRLNRADFWNRRDFPLKSRAQISGGSGSRYLGLTQKIFAENQRVTMPQNDRVGMRGRRGGGNRRKKNALAQCPFSIDIDRQDVDCDSIRPLPRGGWRIAGPRGGVD